ncbi:uncharacterized protein LOC136079377 [Hydra vulgaris]|uniref:Uncharacterized protein LOC136079377 n=1 Tax=Hydra vulgaris TaxID=6087 RepID=A0ABM4BPW9_HYDVU
MRTEIAKREGRFCERRKELQFNRLIINNVHYKVELSALVCDTPARAFVKCIKEHSAYHGCDKCEQHGVYVGCVTFPEIDAVLQTDYSFARMTDCHHHISESPLTNISIKIISQVPADYMHLVCLGVMQKLVYLLLKGPLKTRLDQKIS